MCFRRGALVRVALRRLGNVPSMLLSTSAAIDRGLELERQHAHEVAVRQDLAAAHTLSYHYGYDESIWNHISARLDTDGRFLVTPGDLHFDEVRADDLVASSPDNVNVTSDVIHSTIYKARPDVGAIVHHHTTAVVAVSSLVEGLAYLTQDSAAFYGRVVYHEWEGVSDSYDECARIAAKVAGGANTVIMRHHGSLTFGATVGEAWVRHMYLVCCSVSSHASLARCLHLLRPPAPAQPVSESRRFQDRVCRVQVATAGKATIQPDAAVLEHAARQYDPVDGAFRHGLYEWEALRRQAARLQAAYDRAP